MLLAAFNRLVFITYNNNNEAFWPGDVMSVTSSTLGVPMPQQRALRANWLRGVECSRGGELQTKGTVESFYGLECFLPLSLWLAARDNSTFSQKCSEHSFNLTWFRLSIHSRGSPSIHFRPTRKCLQRKSNKIRVNVTCLNTPTVEHLTTKATESRKRVNGP